MRPMGLSTGDRLMIGACMPQDGPAPDMGLSGGMPLPNLPPVMPPM